MLKSFQSNLGMLQVLFIKIFHVLNLLKLFLIVCHGNFIQFLSIFLKYSRVSIKFSDGSDYHTKDMISAHETCLNSLKVTHPYCLGLYIIKGYTLFLSSFSCIPILTCKTTQFFKLFLVCFASMLDEDVLMEASQYYL